MSSSEVATTSGAENEILANVISQELNNTSTGMLVSEHSYSSEDSDFPGEEYWDDYDDYDDYESARLPRQGHELKHGKLIEKRGSSQEKFTSLRPKTLVKYGKHHFIATADEIDEGAKAIIREFVEKHHYFQLIDINSTLLSGERSVLIHVPGRSNNTTGKRDDFVVKVYRIQYGVERGYRWALKEYHNMHNMCKYANVPNVFYPTKNVGTMNFIGDNGVPAPNLNEVTFEITEKLYNDVITTVHKLFNEAKLVHGKLSAKTILWWRDKFWLISLSHAVGTSDPNALQMLMKDCCHITHFFKSKGLLKVKSIMNLFKYVTGLEQVDLNVLHVLRNTRKPVKHRQKRKQPLEVE